MKTLLITLIGIVLLTGCNDAHVASNNLSTAADNFELERRIVFYNGITNSYMLTLEGKCSVKKDNSDNQLEVICKIGADKFKKHFLGLSDNVTYFIEQLEYVPVNVYHYRVLFKPEAILPYVELNTSKH